MVKVFPPMYLEDIILAMANSTLVKRKRFALDLKKKDESVIASLAHQAYKGYAYTQKQQDLALRLIVLYEDQLKSKLNIDIQNVASIPVRLGTRAPAAKQPDQYQIQFSDKGPFMEIVFPYDESLQGQLKDMRNTVPGTMVFVNDTKTWYVYASNYNIKTFVGFLKSDKRFIIDPELKGAYEQILVQDAQNPLPMQLKEDFTITEASESLVNHLEERTKGMTEDEKITYLVDRAGLYGYTVCDKFILRIYELYGQPIGDMIIASNEEIPAKSPEEINAYATAVNRDIHLVRAFGPESHAWVRLWRQKKYHITLMENMTDLHNMKVDPKSSHAIFTPFSAPTFYRLYLDECANGNADRVLCVVSRGSVSDMIADYTKSPEKHFVLRHEDKFSN